MKHLMKSLGYLVLFALCLCAFDVSSKVAIAAVAEFFDGTAMLTTALYTTIAALGVAWLGVECFGLFCNYMAAYKGKPLLEKYHKELEANWASQKKAIEDKLIEYAGVHEKDHLTNEELKQQISRLNNDLHRSRCTARKFETELTEAQEELKVLRGPLELSPTTTSTFYLNFDDWALDQFVFQMRAKLAQKRAEGWKNWNLQDVDSLRRQLANQSRAGAVEFDPIDVANYAMFLWNRESFPSECQKGDANA